MNKGAVIDTMQFDGHAPVLVLLEKKAVVDHDLLKQWLGANGYLASDAVDIFHALDAISDFTVRERPDVILLEVGSLRDDFRFISRMVHDRGGSERQPIFALSEGGVVNNRECFEGDLWQLKVRLDKMLPMRDLAKRASA
jgi:hypothetical protein